MLLEDLISGTLKSSHIIILDTAKQTGDKIVDAILSRHKSKPIPIHVLCFERDCSEQKRRLKDENSVVFHDFFSDPLGWFSKCRSSVDICEYLCSKLERGTKFILWIDSITSALISIDREALYNQIQKLLHRSDIHGLEVTQLLSTLHEDVDDEETVKLFSQLASSVIKIQPPPDRAHLPLYDLTHNKPNGKLFREMRLFSVGEDCRVSSQPLKQEEKVSSPQPSAKTSASNPVHDTFSTFRHGLSSEEQKARDQLVLPFQRLAMGGAARGQGRIEYEPEEADEWDEDEEDPDDDLEV